MAGIDVARKRNMFRVNESKRHNILTELYSFKKKLFLTGPSFKLSTFNKGSIRSCILSKIGSCLALKIALFLAHKKKFSKTLYFEPYKLRDAVRKNPSRLILGPPFRNIKNNKSQATSCPTTKLRTSKISLQDEISIGAQVWQ